MKLLHLALSIPLVAALAACGGGGSASTEPTVLRLALTDAPACGFEAVNVTIEKVRIHRSDTAEDADEGWSEIAVDPGKQRVDLLQLTNGVLVDLGQTELPAGRYTQMRLMLAANGDQPPFANSVVPEGGEETALTTPSAQQTGLKLNVDIDIPEGKVADFVLDFDACRSVVKRGNSGRYNLKPVIAVIPHLRNVDGQRVVGYVDTALALSTTAVSVQAAGVPVKSTVPGADGKFVLYPVPPGLYDLVVTASGRSTAVMTGVPVSNAAATTVNSAALPIAPPALGAAPGQGKGKPPDVLRTVTGVVTPATATVRALQTLSGGPTVEVANAPVTDTGSFAFSLPIKAPVRIAYVANPTTLDFAQDKPVEGLYIIEAASGGLTKSVPIDANNAVAPLSINF